MRSDCIYGMWELYVARFVLVFRVYIDMPTASHLRGGFVFKGIGFTSWYLLWLVNSYGSCRCAYRFWPRPHGVIMLCCETGNGDLYISCRIEALDLRFKV